MEPRGMRYISWRVQVISIRLHFWARSKSLWAEECGVVFPVESLCPCISSWMRYGPVLYSLFDSLNYLFDSALTHKEISENVTNT